MNLTIKNNITTSEFIIEDYFSIIIKYEDEPLNNRYLGFANNNQDLLEFSLNPVTNSIKKIVLPLCNHYTIYDHSLNIPKFQEGLILIDDEGKKDTETFQLQLYSNCAKITLDYNTPTHYLKMGNVLFGIDESNNIVQLLFIITKEERDHIQFELENT